ncbi:MULTISPECIES: HAD family hydrolase [unclassified Nocardioides]|uniref:HAD family hydrolase n=1 Tax=unclassified Nocardioides TaxID=2615069 RepID=UPI0000570489|nr:MULTISPECIES: HAD family hydrolase [unclassified Nocardioides]
MPGPGPDGFNLSTAFAAVGRAVPDQELLVWRDRRLPYAEVDARVDVVERSPSGKADYRWARPPRPPWAPPEHEGRVTGHRRRMASFDTVVLDIDGTLLDSNYHHALAWSRAFDKVLDRHVPAAVIHRHIGMGGDRLVAAVAGDDVEDQHGDEVRERWEKEYDEVIDQTRLFESARELLVAIGAAGLKVVLASSSIPKHAERPLELLRAGEHSDAWTTSEDAEESKPDPELLDAALEKVAGGRALMVGDAVWDVEAADAQRIPTIGLLCGGTGRQELLDAGAVAVYDDPADLIAHLGEALEAANRS